MALHPPDSLERLKAAQKNSFADAFALAGNVEHVMVAINEINVGVAAFAKKRAIARRESTKCVGRGVANDIGFGFNDASAEPNLRQVVHKRFADEEASKFDGINRQLAPAEAANTNFSARERHAIRSIIRTGFARLTLISGCRR